MFRLPCRAPTFHAAATLVLLGSPIATATAAPTVATPDRCYVHWPTKGSQTIPLTLAGLAPGQGVRVQLRVNGTTVSGIPSLTADGSGSVVTALRNWTSGLGEGPTRGVGATIVVSDLVAGTEVASTPVRIVNAGLEVDASSKRFGTKRRWVVSGLTRLGGGRTYWAFYTRRGRLVGKQRLGRPDDCGYLRTRKRLIPFRQVGKYHLRVQASRSPDRALPWLGGTVTQRYDR